MQLWNLVRSYFPRKFPVGVTEFHAWAERIIALSGKFADEDSMKWALSSALIHLDSTVAAKSDQYFIALMRKAAANQVASQVFQDIKAKQAAAAAAKLAEVTAPPESNSSDQAKTTPN